jgi:amidase
VGAPTCFLAEGDERAGRLAPAGLGLVRRCCGGGAVTTFLLRLDAPTDGGARVAVKDLIDVAGTPTTCASRPVAATAPIAPVDAACVGAMRSSGARIIGKTNLHELAFGGTGINPFTGTPLNPLDPTRIPGGSSSGSAVAVAVGDADIALGTDTAGSIRTPAACCGVVGLKTTHGRLSTAGIYPLAPTLDTVGPLAATVAGVAAAMAMLDPEFAPTGPAPMIGRFRLPGVDPDIEAAIDDVLARSEFPTVPLILGGWLAADAAGNTILFAEAARVHRRLLADHASDLNPETRDRLIRGSAISAPDVEAAQAVGDDWRRELTAALDRTPVVALAGIPSAPPLLVDPLSVDTRRANVAVNLAGNPAIVLPVPRPGGLPTAVQLIGHHGGEELLLATALVLEGATSSMFSH